MAASTGNIGFVPQADNAKAIGAYKVVIPADGTPQVVNPTEPYNAATIYNGGSVLVRATLVFVAGITGNDTAATQTQLIDPGATLSFDFTKSDGLVNGELGVVDTITFTPVATPAATAEASTLTALTANAACQLTVNLVQP
jgi:hypothetical protein